VSKLFNLCKRGNLKKRKCVFSILGLCIKRKKELILLVSKDPVDFLEQVRLELDKLRANEIKNMSDSTIPGKDHEE